MKNNQQKGPEYKICSQCKQNKQMGEKLYYLYDLDESTCLKCYERQYENASYFKKNRIKLYPQIVEIQKGLYLGNEDAAVDVQVIKKYQIGAVLACGYFLLTPFKDTGIGQAGGKHKVQYKVCLVGDYIDENIEQYFKQNNEWIDKKLKENKKVLIHCAAGVSRSASFAISYLIWSKNLDYQSAFKMVKGKRQQICPNPGFVRQLQKLGQSHCIPTNPP